MNISLEEQIEYIRDDLATNVHMAKIAMCPSKWDDSISRAKAILATLEALRGDQKTPMHRETEDRP